MSAATRVETPALAVKPDELPVSCVPGFQVDFTAHLFDEADRIAMFSLWSALRSLCGSAPTSADVYVTRRGLGGDTLLDDSTASWRTLRDVPPADVSACVAHVARRFAPWALPADGAGVVEQIDRCFAAAVAAKIASTAARW
jgi:hypothetical protein